ncbi:MAG TPA: dihydrofolate reductase [Hyphomonadaceae bacterium]|nr:dihydrofolate reductase [Hyphomonadaceae bacterium]
MATPHFPVLQDTIGVRIVAAIGRRGELGFENRLLFRLKDDMANFRAVTRAKPLVMGRKTWDSFPKKPLPGRPNIVATRNLDFEAPGAFIYSSLPPALAAARAMAAKAGADEVCIIGGAEIYAAALDLATDMTLTEVYAEREAHVFFPAFDRKQWREVSARRVDAGPDNEAAFVIRELERM